MIKTIFLLTILSINFAVAQKFDGNAKKFTFLRNAEELNIEYDYSNFGVGKFQTEQAYVTKKVNDLNKKDPSRGALWKTKWEGDRDNRFEPNFQELFNKHLDGNLRAEEGLATAKYTLIVKTTYVEPGFHAVMVRKNAHINVGFIFVESANRSNVLGKIKMTKAPGRGSMGTDYDTGYRIEEAYAKAGKEFGKLLIKSKVF